MNIHPEFFFSFTKHFNVTEIKSSGVSMQIQTPHDRVEKLN